MSTMKEAVVVVTVWLIGTACVLWVTALPTVGALWLMGLLP